MDFTTLSRIQFGVTIGFHYLFALTTLGLAFYILLLESLYYYRKDDDFRRLSDFLIKLLAVVFVFGVTTGFMMPFAFGANWSRFSTFAGPVFGIHLVVESINAFSLEAVSIGVLIFARNKVSRELYWSSALMVFIGSHLSGFWIVSANSWMQTPAGYALENGKVVLTSLFDAVLNPTAIIRFVHVTIGAWITGSVLVAGISAFHLLGNRDVKLFRRLLRLSIPLMMVFTILQAGLGHVHIMKVLEHNPEKDAAYEGIFHTVKGAPLYAFGIPDSGNEKIHFAIGIPYMLSFLETGSFTAEVKGLEEYPKDTWPPVNVIFTTFHLMVMLGAAMIAIAVVGGYLQMKRKLVEQRWYLRVLMFAIPLPYLANELGWIGTEMGRQPWIIYGLLRTDQASTTSIPAVQAVVSLSFIVLLYCLLSYLFLKHFTAAVKKGPAGSGGKEVADG
ncbi:MAG: hypothetical protein A2X45_14970 [Lentisphaerae bacterium GWF2_50_93]|nr:MAG: hypothetical protein A2X45_14970 [Lentisphaerae bacterium GWF2_50_93]